MSKQEIKDEAKENEGNPQIKAKVRRMQRDMRRKNMMKEVATATAVIVNPTHYAVAIHYDRSGMAAPLVVAKGKNYLAAAHPAESHRKIRFRLLRILRWRRHCTNRWTSGRKFRRISTGRWPKFSLTSSG